MISLTNSGLPITLEKRTGELTFHNQLTCYGSGYKTCDKMIPLLSHPAFASKDDLCYRFYRDIAFESDRYLFQKKDLRYDITVILPGTIGEECKKTSGHYHGYIEGTDFTYPEVYEVLEGKALYILQKVMNFNKDEEPVISDLKAVYVEKGESIVIPPFYGHCSVNAGNGPLVFSNLAVVSCPLFYEPIQKKHGLSLYAHKNEYKEITLNPNKNYDNSLQPSIIHPQQNPELGISFGKSVYKEFVACPEKFNYLLEPEPFLETMNTMLTDT